MKIRIRSLVVAALACGLFAACSKHDPGEKQELQQALEKYFLEESRLHDNGWEYYAVQEKPSGLFAYIIFPKSAHVAPVESELRRLCPDARLHDFWQNTQLNSFELVLIKNVDLERGRAKRLEQVTCEDGFDLVAFEAGTLDEPESEIEDKAEVEFAVNIRKPLPDADVQSYFIETNVSEASSLEDTRYDFPANELKRVKEIIDKFSSKEIDTEEMEVYYPGFALAFERVPYFERTLPAAPPKGKYSKYFYQNGYVRVEKEIEGKNARVKNEIFYNDFGAPVVAIERWGHNNGSFFAAVLEYDARGFLNRVTHFSNGPNKIIDVSVYEVEENYDNSRSYYFSQKDNEFKLTERKRHTKEGSYAWNKRTGTERKYTNVSLTHTLKYLEKYPGLAPVLPVSE